MAKHEGTVGRKWESCRRNSLIERPLVKELATVRRNFVATMPTLDRVRQSCNHRSAVKLGVFALKMKYQSPFGLLKPFRGR